MANEFEGQLFDARGYWEQRLRKDWSLEGVGTLGLSARYQQWLYRLKELAIHRVLRSAGFTIAGSRILNVGCGVGYFEDFFERRGATVAGADFTLDSINQLRRRHPSREYIHHDVADPFPKSVAQRRFDMVTAIDVLYHIVDDQSFQNALRNVCSLTDPRGVILLTDVFPPTAAHGTAHVKFRPRAAYESILSSEGFRIVEIRPMFALLNNGYPRRLYYRCRQAEAVLLPCLFAADAVMTGMIPAAVERLFANTKILVASRT